MSAEKTVRLDSEITVNGSPQPQNKDLKKSKKKKSSPSIKQDLAQQLQKTQVDEPLETEEAFEKQKNPYLESISKRLRGLKKKMQRINKYEELPKADLNKDQVQIIEKKPELETQIRELEEMHKQMVTIDAEEQVTLKKAAKAAEVVEASKIRAAVDEEKINSTNALRSTVQLLYVLNYVFSNLATTPVAISDEQYAVLSYLKVVVTSAGYEQLDSISDFVEPAMDHLTKYVSRSADVFYNGFSYEQLNDLVSLIISPPPPLKFGVVEETEVEPVELVNVSTGQIYVPHSEEPLAETRGISFMHPSEVLDETVEPAEYAHAEAAPEPEQDVLQQFEEQVYEAEPSTESTGQDPQVKPELIDPETPSESAPPAAEQGFEQQQRGGYRGRGRGNRGGGEYRGNREGGGYRGRGSYHNRENGGHRENGGYREGGYDREGGYSGRGGQRRGRGGYRGGNDGGGYRGGHSKGAVPA